MTDWTAHQALREHTPETDMDSSLPTVGVVAAIMELVEEMEEVLSARAKGAMGGGLAEWTGGLNGRFWPDKKIKGRLRSEGEQTTKNNLVFEGICWRKTNKQKPSNG